ncbi:MAG: hypothetical protein AB7T06_21040 [Kofleriaceae bacterium]
MTNSKRFKVLAIMAKSDGTGEYFTRVGSAFENKDSSINVYMDLLPLGNKQVKLQIRELNDQDLREREQYRARSLGDPLGSRAAVASASTLSSSADNVPF